MAARIPLSRSACLLRARDLQLHLRTLSSQAKPLTIPEAFEESGRSPVKARALSVSINSIRQLNAFQHSSQCPMNELHCRLTIKRSLTLQLRKTNPRKHVCYSMGLAKHSSSSIQMSPNFRQDCRTYVWNGIRESRSSPQLATNGSLQSTP